MSGILDILLKRLQDANGEHDGEAFTVELYFHGDYRSRTQPSGYDSPATETQSVEIALTAVCTDGVAGIRVSDQRQSVSLYPLTAIKEIVIWEGGKP